ncbi:MAG: leucine-rich repeat domain-containing protein [Pirellulaceae bacterium]
MREWFLGSSVLFGLIAVSGVEAEELQPGDAAVIVRADVEFGLRDREITRLEVGAKVLVTEVSDPWIGCAVMVGGKQELGWIHKRDVIRIVAWEDLAPATDADSAVDAFRKMNVRVDRDGRGRIHAVDATEAVLPDDALAYCQFFEHLVVLDLGGTEVGDAGLKHLQGLAFLERLYLDHTRVTDLGLKHLQSLQKLEVLVLEGTEITGAGLETIKPLRELRTLNLSFCAVQDEDLRHLSELSKLEVLTLQHSLISGEGLKYLRPIRPLRVLNLDHSEVQDAGLVHLEGMPSLRMLHVRETAISQAVADHLDGTLTSCAIYLSS